MKRKYFMVLFLLAMTALLLAACATATPEVTEKIVKETVIVQVTKEVEVTTEAVQPVEAAQPVEEYTTPHPILSDIRVRQAIAQCINRDELIAAAYPYVEDKGALRMDSFLPKTHWAYKGPYQDYPYDPEAAGKLLDEAGWTLQEGNDYRTNADGDALALKLTTSNSQLRQTWAAVAEQNLAGCGIQLVRLHAPGSWWFGDTTGLARRDFELGAFAWVGESDPKGRTLYACNQIPLPSNNWEGQNSMGWCNETASQAIVQANNTLIKDERVKWYDIAEQEFAKDMVSLPLFQRAEAEAWSKNLEGIKISPTEYATKSIADWKMVDGSDTAVIGLTQEPASMWGLVESASVQKQAADIGIGVIQTQFDYDFQPALQDPLSTLESGLANNEVVEVKAGDKVYDSEGEPVTLEQGVKVFDAEGNEVEYDGSSTLNMKQLTNTYKFKDYTWSDGTPGSIEDFKLAYKTDCDPESGATEFITCNQIQEVTWGDGLEYTIKFLPGVQDARYFLAQIGQYNGPYPSHQVLSDGRMLKDVPAAEWATLPEIAETPLSYGPFFLTEWKKGESMTFEVNPYYEPQPALKKVVVVFIQDTNQAVAQLISGDIDYLERATLGGGPEVQTVLDAAKEGKVNAEIVASPTWEHIDFNLNIK